MRSLLRYFIKNYAFVLFLMLEIISVAMVFNFNKYHKALFINTSNKISGTIYETFANIKNYFYLVNVNKQLAEENARLKSSPKYGNEIININNLVTNLHGDSSSYKYTTALVINNSINKPYNYITLNKGTRHGIKPDQGIISVNGIVGVTFKVSDSFTLAMSVLNNRWSISAKIKKNNYFGSLVWQGGDYRTASLREIPIHVNISKGDTVVTSGFSSIFPEGIMIGIIENFSRKEGDNYYTIDLSLAADFKSLAYVEVIENFNSYEILKLEEITEND